MKHATAYLLKLTALAIVALVATDPSLAGEIQPVPGPLLGLGAPALALFAGGYYLIRKRRGGG